MQKIVGLLMAVLFVFTVCSGTALAGDKEDTLALVKKGTEYIQKNGVQKAVEAFQGADFKKGELFLFTYDYTGNCLANGGRPDLVGKNLWNMKTPTGKFMIREQVEISKKGGGWLDYEWMHETKKVLLMKTSYVEPVSGMEAYVACGYFKE